MEDNPFSIVFELFLKPIFKRGGESAIISIPRSLYVIKPKKTRPQAISRGV
jgi:hypothetical protein